MIQELAEKLALKGLGGLATLILGKKGKKTIEKIENFLGVKGEKEIAEKIDNPEVVKALKELEIKELELHIQSSKNFRDFVIEYEGKAENMPVFVQILRSLIRPLLTLIITITYIYAWLNPEKFSPAQMMILKPAVLIVLIFWFGDRALQKSGILDIFKGKK